jgi:hypothetical protein
MRVQCVRASLQSVTARNVSGYVFENIVNRDLDTRFEVGAVIFKGVGSMGSGQRTAAFAALQLRLTSTSHDTLWTAPGSQERMGFG